MDWVTEVELFYTEFDQDFQVIFNKNLYVPFSKRPREYLGVINVHIYILSRLGTS